MPRHADSSSRSRRVPGRTSAMMFLLPLALVASGCSPDEPVPVSSLGAVVEAGRIEMAGSGFAITIPDGWTVEVFDPEPDVFSAEPGMAWEALRASAPYNSMACSLAVGVTEPPPNRWLTVVPDDGTAAYWDPSKPWQLRVPTPDVPQSQRLHTTWERPEADQEANQEHSIQYSLLCAANEVRVGGSGRFFGPLVDSFEFLPVE